jgi:hypothetical protein
LATLTGSPCCRVDLVVPGFRLLDARGDSPPIALGPVRQ